MQVKLNVGITGSTGFIGCRFLEYNQSNFNIRVLNLRKDKPEDMDLKGLDTILHFAGLAHQMTPVPDEEYFKTNVDITLALARKAKADGVKHFIYVSSTKVYGDDVHGILNEYSDCKPTDAYGSSKLKAEEMVSSMSAENFIVAIVRPPVVYGPRVKGNILKLAQLAKKKVPLPFGNIKNARSMVFLDNIIELLNVIIQKRASGIFIAGDALPVSTEYLVSEMQMNFHNKKSLFAIPFFLRKIIKTVKPELYKRLFDSYVIDNSSTNEALGFTPPYQTSYGIKETIQWFKKNNLN